KTGLNRVTTQQSFYRSSGKALPLLHKKSSCSIQYGTSRHTSAVVKDNFFPIMSLYHWHEENASLDACACRVIACDRRGLSPDDRKEQGALLSPPTGDPGRLCRQFASELAACGVGRGDRRRRRPLL